MAEKLELLKTRFGLHDFRPGQEAVLSALLAGRDVLAAMPDGGGKSLCWQLAAGALPGLTLALSPSPRQLQAQVRRLEAVGIPARYCGPEDALMPPGPERGCRVVCTTPDRLTGPALMSLACVSPLSLVVVEEAQCISPWQPEHRQDYDNITNLIRLLPTRPAVGAFTSVAAPEVREDIRSLLLLRDPLAVTAGYGRDNLELDVSAPRRKDAWVLDFVRSRPGQSGVICCGSPQLAQALAKLLRENALSVLCCHQELAPDRQAQALEAYQADHAQVLVTTAPFLERLDKPNIRFLLHYSLPGSLEDYRRQLTRAGRDGESAQCVLLFSPADVQSTRLRELEDSPGGSRTLQQLDQVVDYCKTTDCLPHYLLHYFGQSAPAHCGHCGNCTCKYVRQDITRDARLILAAVGRIEERFPFGLGRALIVPMLQGSRERRILRMGLDQLPDFGVLAHLSKPQIRAYIDALLREGCLYTTDGEFPVLRRTELGIRSLERGESFTYQVRMKRQSRRQKPPLPVLGPEDSALTLELKTLRTAIARELSLPAYVIFTDSTLADMALRKPQTTKDLLQVSGVGKVKAARYGSRFLDCIRHWLERH